MERVGPSAFGIKQVALEAGVGRPTVYRYFQGRDELLNATIIRLGARRAAEIDRATRDLESVSEVAVMVTIHTIARLRQDALPRTRPGHAGFADSDFIRLWNDPNMLEHVMTWFEPLIRRTNWTTEESQECAETIIRFAYSLAAAPSLRQRGSLAELRGYIERRLLPALGLAPAPDSQLES